MQLLLTCRMPVFVLYVNDSKNHTLTLLKHFKRSLEIKAQLLPVLYNFLHNHNAGHLWACAVKRQCETNGQPSHPMSPITAPHIQELLPLTLNFEPLSVVCAATLTKHSAAAVGTGVTCVQHPGRWQHLHLVKHSHVPRHSLRKPQAAVSKVDWRSGLDPALSHPAA